MDTLYERLKKYGESDYYGFHMPGHKRNTDLMPGIDLPYRIDITEIEGFDDLHHPSGILRDAQAAAAAVYKAEETFFLVNGSTVGILSAILGSTDRGDRVLAARNCHRSVYHALYLNELEPVYLYPRFREDLQLNTEVSASAVKTALKEYPGIRAVIVTSPTYDGVISDIKAIADAAHEHDAVLIVDEAHGAHLGFHPYFDDNANQKGADVVIHSLHKTLPALTQTALLHLNGARADRRKIKRYLDMLQSSSPSYVLMAGIDQCIRMLESGGREWFEPYVERLEHTREALGRLKRLRLTETERYDRSKLVLSVRDTDLTGRWLYRKLLSDYHLQMEMAAGSYVLAMTSIGDTPEGLRRLEEALAAIDAEADRRMSAQCGEGERRFPARSMFPRARTAYTARQMEEMRQRAAAGTAHGGTFPQIRALPWEKSEGYVAAEYAYLYPPGCPIVTPGEWISGEAVEIIGQYRGMGFVIEGPEREGYIEVLING